jgi:N-acetylmuramoyl-L-alanine amidase
MIRTARKRIEPVDSDNQEDMSEPGAYYQVQQGDNLTLIALKFGFSGHSALYNHPRNAAFKRQRPNPDVLFPGDRIFIPKLRLREESCSTDMRHRFVKKTPKKLLRIVVQDADGKPLENAPYKLILEATSGGRNIKSSGWEELDGQTGNDGLIEHHVSVDVVKGRLIMSEVVWTLSIGYLNPPKETSDEGISGIQARLSNLGFDPGPVDGKLGRNTRDAIREFQRRHPPLEVDGVCGPETTKYLMDDHNA